MNSETVAPYLYLENWHYSIRMECLRKCLWYPESPLQFQWPPFGRYDDLVKGFAAMYSLFPWPGVPVWLIKLDIFQEFSRILLYSAHWEILTIPHKPRGQVVYGRKPVRAFGSLLLLRRWFLNGCCGNGPRHRVGEVPSSWRLQCHPVFTPWASEGKACVRLIPRSGPGTWPHVPLFCLSVRFGHATRHMRSSFPDQGSNPCPLQWKQGVLTMGPPRKSPVVVFIFFHSLKIRHVEVTVAASYLGTEASTVTEAVVSRWEHCHLMKYHVWSAFLGALADRNAHDGREGCVDRLIIARRTQLVGYSVRFKTWGLPISEAPAVSPVDGPIPSPHLWDWALGSV